MATRISIPRGSTVYFLLSWTRDGAALDLTGAALSAFIKATPETPDCAAAFQTSDAVPQLVFTWRDDPAGLAILQFKAGATAGQFYGAAPIWQAAATLANGDVIIAEAHQGPLFVPPRSGNSLDAAWGDCPPVDGVTQTLAPGGTVALLPPAMANYVLNRSDLTGITGGTSATLDGLSAATLAALAPGAKVELSFTGDIECQFKLTALISGTAPWVVPCVNDTARCWQLVRVSRLGQPCAWNAATGKWYKLWSIGPDGAALPAMDLTGFSLPR
jgi:hypothetical protein